MDHSLDALISSLADKPGALDASSLASTVSKHHIKISDHSIASIIALLVKKPEYPADTIGEGLKKYNESIDWEKVFSIVRSAEFSKSLDFSSNRGIEVHLSILKFLDCFSSDKFHAIDSYLTPGYHDPSTQLNLFIAACSITKDQFNYNTVGLKTIVNNELISDAPESIVIQARELIGQSLNYQRLIQLCLDAVIRSDPNDLSIKHVLEEYAQTNPELLLLGGVEIPQPWPILLERILSNFFELFFAGHENSQIVLFILSKINPSFVIKMLGDIFSRRPNLLGRLLAIASDVGLLNKMPQITNFTFSLELMAQADSQNLYSFEDFIKEAESLHGEEFIRSLLNFLEMKASLEYSNNQRGNINVTNDLPSINLKSAAAALSLITSIDIPQDRIEQFKSIQIQCLQAFPRLINFGRGHDEAILAAGDNHAFSSNIEQEMKMYYQKMYEQQVDIRDIISMLQRLKESDNTHDQDIFACMVHSLFDEYRFFPEYPLNALATSAVLFGSLVYFHLIDGMPLSIALRFILESLRMPTDSNMFRFGLQALFEFRQRLHEFPKYCTILLEIPGLAAQQDFYQQIKDIVDGKTIENNLESQGLGYQSVNSEVRLGDGIQETPTESISDKVLFLVNNLAQSNVVGKSKDLARLLDKKYHKWFASYIVNERSMREPNYHNLYISMLEEINDSSLEKHCLKTTYQLIIQYLNSPNTISSSEKRSQLRNLGQWLGSLLLARDRPILYKNIAFKKLLVESYDFKQLPVVVPFVCKILEKATGSTVFLPPNPWLMGIFMVLSELYRFADLKLNLKFEIEVLCNQFDMDINTIEPSTIIRYHSLEETDLRNNLTADMQRMRIGDNQMNNSIDISPQDSLMFSNMISHIQLVGATPFVMNPALKKMFLSAIEQSLRDILQPVVERSVTIASITAKELISKDFVLEPDEQKMRFAANNMSRVLAASLSLVTCKDPLRESLTDHLKNLMVNNGYADHDILSEQVVMAVNDNIGIISSIVEKSAIAKSSAEIETVLSSAYMLRKAHAETGGGKPFIDPQFNSRYALRLPEAFKLRTGGLSPQQYSVYEKFGSFGPNEVVSDEPLLRNDLNGLQQQQQAPAANNNRAAIEDLERRGIDPQVHFDQVILQMQSGIDSLEKLISESTETSLSQLSTNHPVSVLLSQILSVGNRSVFKDQVILKTSQVVVSALFTTTESQLGREVFCFLLDKLCELSATTAKEVVLWLIYSDDERKYNVAVMITLIKAKLITASEIDVNLSKQVMAGVEPAINFAAGLIYEAVLSVSPCALRTEFTGCLAAMEKLANEDNEVAKNLLAAMEESVSSAGPWALSNDESSNIKDQMGYIFAEWVRLTQHPSQSKRSFHLFVYQLSKHGILNNAELLCTFIRTSLELSVESYRKGVLVNSHATVGEIFVAIDALAKLVATIISTSNAMSTKTRTEYLKNILNVVCLVLAADEESDSDGLSQRAYFRFFSSLLYEVSISDLPLDYLPKLYLSFADIFAILQPLAFPEFSFAWETLISHRLFLPKIMDLPDKKGWSCMANLLCLLLTFQDRYIEGVNFSDSIVAMHKGCLRIFLVILHDYPLFLVEYHSILCNSMPQSYVQLRNLVLSAFPSDIQLPDPLSQNMKMTELLDCKKNPPMASDVLNDLQTFGLKKLVDNCLRSLTGQSAKMILYGLKLTSPKKQIGLGFDTVNANITAVNSLVLYLVMSESEGLETSKKLLTSLLIQSDIETRYFIVSAMVDQLRYPNSHTCMIHELILSMFGTEEAGDEKLAVEHSITRVLLERIICNRPHPWGLMVTFTKLLKEPQYKFWDLPFTKTPVEVGRMFLALYNHIMSEGGEEMRQEH